MNQIQEWFRNGLEKPLNWAERLSGCWFFSSIILCLLAVQANVSSKEDDDQVGKEDERVLGLVALSSFAFSTIPLMVVCRRRCRQESECNQVPHEEPGEEMQPLVGPSF
jgi:hypothetical protein